VTSDEVRLGYITLWVDLDCILFYLQWVRCVSLKIAKIERVNLVEVINVEVKHYLLCQSYCTTFEISVLIPYVILFSKLG